MRFVIDMQAAQLEDETISQNAINFALSVAKNCGDHEIILILSGFFPKSIEPIRGAFYGVIPSESIRVWSSPGSICLNSLQNRVWNKTSEIIRDEFIRKLKPDLVHLFGSINPYENDVILGIPHDDSQYALSATFIESDFDIGSKKKLEQNFKELFKDNIAKLLTCSNIFVDSAKVKNHLLDNYDVSESSVIDLSEPTDGNWNNAAEKIIAAWEGAVNFFRANHLSPKPITKKKLAYISPMPPAKTGIADYSAELIKHLSDFYDIEIINICEDVVDAEIQSFKSIEWFRSNYYFFDRIIYHIGNSHFHCSIANLIEKIPGISVLHDFYLGHMMQYMEWAEVDKFAWRKSLYESHGYKALEDFYGTNDISLVTLKYPVNFNIIQNSIGMIVHSKYAKSLGEEFYGPKISDSWKIVPLIRESAKKTEKKVARKKLGIQDDTFLVTSFGHINPLKHNIKFVEAWMKSSLSNSSACKLIFVGECPDDVYGLRLKKTIQDFGLNIQISITGYVSAEDYCLYLSASDLAVQLRSESRGETSAAVFDCMSYGLPLIVNANGSMAELNKECVFIIPDKFTDHELIVAIESLFNDSNKRAQIGCQAASFVALNNSGHRCAQLYFQAVEEIYESSSMPSIEASKRIIHEVGYPFESPELIEIAKHVARSLPNKYAQKKIFFDISVTHNLDLKTGIQRVVRAMLLSLIESPPHGYRIEPVYMSDEGGVWQIRYARKYSLEILGCQPDGFSDDPIEVGSEDILLLADYSPSWVVEIERASILSQLRSLGVRVWTIVYDLLPVLMPQYFPSYVDGNHQRWLEVISSFDGVVCISKAVSEEYAEWRSRNKLTDVGRVPFSIRWLHLGADISSSAPSKGLPKDATKMLNILSSKITFLMVGTVEPRKGHLQVIEAFNLLWDRGFDIALCIVGKAGWLDSLGIMDQTFTQLRKNKELGKRLLWIEDATDEFLEKIYDASDCLVAASYGEGFGLPLIEAAQFGLPIIARKIPVFLEVGEEYAYYFSSTNAMDLAGEISQWLKLNAENKAPSSGGMRYLTWRESSEELVRILTT